MVGIPNLYHENSYLRWVETTKICRRSNEFKSQNGGIILFAAYCYTPLRFLFSRKSSRPLRKLTKQKAIIHLPGLVIYMVIREPNFMHQ